MLDQLAGLLQQTDLVTDAIRTAAADIDADRPRWEEERKQLDAEIARTDAALDRYFRAFESGTMPEQQCGQRIDALSRQLTGLKAPREELTADEADARAMILSDDDIASFQSEAVQTIRDGEPPAQKALLHALVGEIRVAGRDRIQPTYLLPAGVRIPAGSVPLRGFEPRFVPLDLPSYLRWAL